MRRAARTDANHDAIRKAFRQIGASVCDLSAVGKGCPDLLVGWRGRTYLFEVKDGNKRPSARRLTGDQEAFHAAWAGHVAVVESVEEAIGLMAKES